MIPWGKEDEMYIDDMSFEDFQRISCEEATCTEKCYVVKALQVLGGKWNLIVLYQLSKRPSFRFGELRKAIPNITNTMLTNTLRDLEELRVVSREQFNEIPPHVEYSLTKKGEDLFPIFFEMAKWSVKYM